MITVVCTVPPLPPPPLAARNLLTSQALSSYSIRAAFVSTALAFHILSYCPVHTLKHSAMLLVVTLSTVSLLAETDAISCWPPPPTPSPPSPSILHSFFSHLTVDSITQHKHIIHHMKSYLGCYCCCCCWCGVVHMEEEEEEAEERVDNNNKTDADARLVASVA